MGKAIPDLRGDIANMGDLLRNPIIADIDHDMDTVIEYLDEQDNEIEVLKKRVRLLSSPNLSIPNCLISLCFGVRSVNLYSKYFCSKNEKF